MTSVNVKNDLVSAAQIGRRVGISRHTILRRAKKNQIPCYRFGRTLVRFDPEETIQALLVVGRQSEPNELETHRDDTGEPATEKV